MNEIEEVYRRESRRVFATLVRLLGDFDLAEESLHEAFAVALIRWPKEGVPANPMAWLVSTGRFKAVDILRRRKRFSELHEDLTLRNEAIQSANLSLAEQDVKDDRLRLIFTCCHPAIDPKVQVPLTLREVCGMTTEEIASAFLTTASTMAQRIVCGKAKIRAANIPYVVPSIKDLPERLGPVLAVIYLVFNEGYSATGGESLIRQDLSDEAIRLARLMYELLPDPEVMGLLALMLLHESRRTARMSDNGDIVLLEDQDRSLWNRELIAEGTSLIRRSLESQQFGRYTIQAAISAVHAEAATASKTDWSQIVALYNVLMQLEPSPVVDLNRAVALAMRDGPATGLHAIEQIIQRGELADYHLLYSAKGELHRRLGNRQEAIDAFHRAMELTQQEPERRFLTRKLQSLDALGNLRGAR